MMNVTFCAEAGDCISRYVYAGLQGGSLMRGRAGDERVMTHLLQQRHPPGDLQTGADRQGG